MIVINQDERIRHHQPQARRRDKGLLRKGRKEDERGSIARRTLRRVATSCHEDTSVRTL